MNFYLIQGISILTTIAAIWSMQFKSMKGILLSKMVVNLLCASSYFFLDGFSGAGICLVAIVQSIVLYFYNVKNKETPLWVIIAFILAYIACSVVYYTAPVDLISSIAAVCFAISLVQKSPTASRLWYSLNPFLWIFYDIPTRAYGNLVMHVIIFVVAVVTIIRLDVRRKPKKDKN